MRYQVIEEKEYKGYAVLDTATSEVLYRAKSKKDCEKIALAANSN